MFLYHINYVERVPDFVASHFGPATARALFDLEPDDGSWRGPFESPYGFHLVMLTASEEGRTPDLDEIYDRVEEDARQTLLRVKKEKAIQDIIGTYDVRVVYRKGEGEPE